MPTIREVKTELRHREWVEQIKECQSSGMTVMVWCKEKGISQHTYYSRLKVVRKELLKRTEQPLQPIVPLRVSQSVTCTAAVQMQCIQCIKCTLNRGCIFILGGCKFLSGGCIFSRVGAKQTKGAKYPPNNPVTTANVEYVLK